jgi:hypothetical protein
MVADLGTLIALLGIGLFGLKGVLIVRDSRHLPSSKTLLESKPTAKLPTQVDAGDAPSITAHTTRNFEPVYKSEKQNDFGWLCE